MTMALVQTRRKRQTDRHRETERETAETQPTASYSFKSVVFSFVVQARRGRACHATDTILLLLLRPSSAQTRSHENATDAGLGLGLGAVFSEIPSVYRADNGGIDKIALDSP